MDFLQLFLKKIVISRIDMASDKRMHGNSALMPHPHSMYEWGEGMSSMCFLLMKCLQFCKWSHALTRVLTQIL